MTRPHAEFCGAGFAHELRRGVYPPNKLVNKPVSVISSQISSLNSFHPKGENETYRCESYRQDTKRGSLA